MLSTVLSTDYQLSLITG